MIKLVTINRINWINRLQAPQDTNRYTLTLRLFLFLGLIFPFMKKGSKGRSG